MVGRRLIVRRRRRQHDQTTVGGHFGVGDATVRVSDPALFSESARASQSSAPTASSYASMGDPRVQRDSE
jgi:hypothetical protein